MARHEVVNEGVLTLDKPPDIPATTLENDFFRKVASEVVVVNSDSITPACPNPFKESSLEGGVVTTTQPPEFSEPSIASSGVIFSRETSTLTEMEWRSPVQNNEDVTDIEAISSNSVPELCRKRKRREKGGFRKDGTVPSRGHGRHSGYNRHDGLVKQLQEIIRRRESR